MKKKVKDTFRYTFHGSIVDAKSIQILFVNTSLNQLTFVIVMTIHNQFRFYS